MHTAQNPAVPNIHTPWGMSDHAHEIAPGIVEYTTPSHGGIKLSLERWIEFCAVLPAFTSFTGPSWLEEDCDAIAAVLVWPQFFESHDCAVARGFAMTYGKQKGQVTDAYWLTPNGQALAKKAEQFNLAKETANV